MKNPIVHLKEMRSELSPSEQNVCDYILANPKEVSTMSVHKLAKACFSSPSTIIRCTTKIGASGYREFRNELIRELASKETDFENNNTTIKKGESTQEILSKVTSLSMNALQETYKLMDVDTLNECVALISNADKLLFFGIGASYSSAKDAYMKFLRVNKTCMINEDWHNQLLTARNSTSQDVAIVVSYSGHTTEMIVCAEQLKLQKTPIIAITRCVSSPLSDLADYKLFTTSQEPIIRSGAIASRISQQYITDILYSAYVAKEYDACLELLTKTHIEKP